MGLKEFYFSLEDKYYAALDWLDTHGLPVYKVVDSIEGQNIPSFPIAAFLLLLVVGGLFVFVLGNGLGGGSSLSVLVQDDTQTPLKGISVQLSGDGLTGDSLTPKLTDETGHVVFANLSPGTLVHITSTSDAYSASTQTVVLDAGLNEQSITAQALSVTHSLLLHLYKTGTNESFSDAVQLQFSCSANSSYSASPTVTNGQVSLDVPSDCGTLSASTTSTNITLADTTIDTQSEQPSLSLSITPTGNGVLRANYISESGSPVAGITVILKSKFGDQIAQKFTDTDGLVEFAGLVPDTYTLFTPSDGTFGEFDSGSIEVNDTAPVSETYTLQAASVGEVRIQLVDESSLAPVGGAKVTLSKGNQTLLTKTTNDGGQVTFSVSSSNALTVSADHPSYLIKSGIAVSLSSAGYTQIPMTKATLQNSQIVTVNVVDELGQPVENAYVSLKKSPSGANVGTNKITGASGTVSFSSLEEGSYFASAYKPGFSDQLRSDIFTVQARQNVQATVKLVLGNGTISFAVKGFDGQPLAGATIQPMDGVDHTPIGSEITTGVDGGAELTLRADKYAYFLVTEPNHLPFVTIPLQVKKGISQAVNVDMVKDIQKLEVKPLGIFVNGSPVLSDSGFAPGQTYTIRFGLFVPRNSVFSETGVHLRTGTSTDGQTNPIENDDWMIHAVRGAFSSVQRGTTYTPPVGVSIDAQHLTSADAKWANLVFSSPHDGLTVFEADFTVKDTAAQGADLPLYYRAWGKTGSYVRFPVDAVLGGSESVSEKQGLYAQTNLKLYSTGATTNLCGTDFCLGLVAEDLGTQLQSTITSDYEADVGTKHKFLFTFTSISDNVFADTSLILQSSSGSANLGAYEVTNAVGAKKTGGVTGNKTEIPLGSIQKNNVVFGFVNVDATKEGSARVKLSLVSNKKELFAREILFKVNAAGIMNVEVVPKAILPLLVNQMLIHVTQTQGGDEIPLEDASVSVALNNTLLTSGFTDTEGTFPFELHEPNVNDQVKITVEKPGFSPVVQLVNVGSDIVGFIPTQVNETLVVNGSAKKTRDIRLFNLANIPLTLKEISLSGDFEGLVKFDLLNDEIIGDTLGINADENVSFALSLTEKGQKLLNPRTFKGRLVVKVDAGDTGKTFVNTLPLNVKIGFGGDVDSETCLLIDPASWDIFSDPSETKQRAVELTNTCTVNGVPVKLTNLSAKIKQVSGDAIGSFTAASGQKNAELGTDFKTLLDEIPAGGTTTINLSFVPSALESGTAMPQIVFQATNLTDNGVPDLLTATLKTNIVINALTKCVQINTPTSLSIDSCPINMASGQYGNYFNQTYRPTGVPYYNPSYGVLNQTSNPSGSSLLPSSVSGGYGSYYGTGLNSGAYGPGGYDGLGNYSPNGALFSPAMGTGYSSMQGYYNNPLVDRYNYSSNLGGLYGGCGTAEVRIENACQSPVEINLDADPNLTTSANTFVLKPNENQRVRIGAGYRIGKYSVAINAHVAGSQEPSKEVNVVDVLIKSPTEVNADCITLSTTTFRFNDFIQKPIKGSVINKCYDSGVRLVPSADTVTIASFFNGNDQVQLTEKGSTKSKPNSLVHDIQLIGVNTSGQGSDTIQTLEFQIFPDFDTYKRVFSPIQGGGIGKTISDLKFFAEGQYYRAESYGTISVKYLDPFGGGQQKPFPVIFENLFKIAGILDLGEGSPDVTKYQDCINPNALQFRNTGADPKNTGNKIPLEFDSSDFENGSLITYVTTSPNEVMIADDAHCGGRDFLSDLKTTSLVNPQFPGVQATFKIADNRNIQVTLNRPSTLASDVVIQGTLKLSLTRVSVNSGTQDVTVPVKITILHGNAKSTGQYALLACSDEGYENGGGFSTTYGFDKLKWDWTYNGSPTCDSAFCDATQFAIDLAKKVKKFNAFIRVNKQQGVFNDTKPGSTDPVEYTTSNFVRYINQTIGPITRNATSGNTDYVFFQSTGGNTLGDMPINTPGKPLVTNTLKDLSTDLTYVNPSNAQLYVNNLSQKLANVDADPNGHVVLQTLALMINDAKLSDAQRGLLEKMGAEKFVFADTKARWVWMYPEFKAVHDALKTSGTQTTVTLGNLVGKGAIGSVSMNDLKDIYKGMDSVVPAFPVSVNGTDADFDAMDAESIAYLLKHSKQKTGVSFGEYNGLEDLRTSFITTSAYLLPDSFSPAFFTDLKSVNGEGYNYTNAFEAGSGSGSSSTLVMDAVSSAQFKNANTDTPNATYTIPIPGKYPVRIRATWNKTKDGILPEGFVVQIPKDDASVQSLAEMDEASKPDAGSEPTTKYAQNPFFEIPFNGKTYDSAKKRNQYGVSLALTNMDDPLAPARAALSSTNALDTPVTGGATQVNVNTYPSLASMASFIQHGDAGLPTMFTLTKDADKKFTMDFAPSVPVPLKLSLTNPTGLATFQYGFREGAQKTNYEALDASPILWTDCTTKTRTLVAPALKPSCDITQTRDQSLNPSGAGNAFTYTGVALVPAQGDFFLDAKCAVSDATIKGPATGQELSVDNSTNTQIQALALKNVNAGTVPKSLQDMLTAIAKGKACGRIASDAFSIIWDTQKITPNPLTCAGK